MKVAEGALDLEAISTNCIAMQPRAMHGPPGVHVLRLAWGRMTYIGIYPDTVGVVTTLQRPSRAGVAEATAEKIEG
jgi:hypothetical protein